MLFWLTGRYFVLEAHDPHCDGTGRSPSALSFSAAQILLHCHILWHDRGKERRPHHGNNKPSDTSQHRLMVILREAYHLYIFFISGNILALDEWMWRVFTSPWLAQRHVLKIGCVFTVFLMIVTAIKKQKKTTKKNNFRAEQQPPCQHTAEQWDGILHSWSKISLKSQFVQVQCPNYERLQFTD